MICRIVFSGVVSAVLLVTPSAQAEAAAGVDEITGLNLDQVTAGRVAHEQRASSLERSGRSNPTQIFLRKAIGYHLDLSGAATTETYEAYFHVPVPFQEQVPIKIHVESPYLVDYRFIRLSADNILGVARLLPGGPTYINWIAWILVVENTYADLPDNVPIPTPEELPDSVLQWLVPTDCAQSEAPIVQEIAAEIRGSTTNLIQLADDIALYVDNIPWIYPHSPVAFDAVYSLNWGSSCTGHAHAGVALFRANGVPARTLLNLPIWSGSTFTSMHWAMDYFAPDYGWVRVETSYGEHPSPPDQEIVTFACDPGDEYCLFVPRAIEGRWYTSDPALGMEAPNWGTAHRARAVCSIEETSEKIMEAHALTSLVFDHYADCRGILLTPTQDAAFQAAYVEQSLALESFEGLDLDEYIDHMEAALDWYESMELAEATTIFYDDFEGALNAWSHDGTNDEWELGIPTYGPTAAHSGARCWGTDLDDTYENNADCWLISPWIDLSNLSCAYFGFWIWNWVHDTRMHVYDPLWVEITLDGATYLPLSSHMGGVNDDPVIPDVGGWSYMALDLTKYVGNSVRIRFHFSSNDTITQFGSYLDDIHVWGRDRGPIAFADDSKVSPLPRLLPGRPNPAQASTIIEYALPQPERVRLTVFDLNGRQVRTLVDDLMESGSHVVHWNGCDAQGFRVPAGSYLYRLETERGSSTRRIVLLR
jgi:transglutaminase-like putative cysteine protease